MRTKAKYDFAAFVRPGGYWPHPYSVEQAFGVLRWMVQTGTPYHSRGTWGTHSIHGLLSCKPTCVNFNEIEPISSLGDLERRFHYGLLENAGARLEQWRQDFGVKVYSQRTITFKHSEPFKDEMCEAAIKRGLDSLMKASGRLTVQLNEYHRGAKDVLGVRLHLRGTWIFVLNYGYQGSVWYRTLARQTKDQTFVAAFQRAVKELSRLTDPANAGQLEAA